MAELSNIIHKMESKYDDLMNMEKQARKCLREPCIEFRKETETIMKSFFILVNYHHVFVAHEDAETLKEYCDLRCACGEELTVVATKIEDLPENYWERAKLVNLPKPPCMRGVRYFVQGDSSIHEVKSFTVVVCGHIVYVKKGMRTFVKKHCTIYCGCGKQLEVETMLPREKIDEIFPDHSELLIEPDQAPINARIFTS